MEQFQISGTVLRFATTAKRLRNPRRVTSRLQVPGHSGLYRKCAG